MSSGPLRATFSSLRARREAYQIASDILYEEPIDIRTVACHACGRWLDVHGSTVTDPLTCPKCGAQTALPSYLRAKYLPRAAPTALPSYLRAKYLPRAAPMPRSPDQYFPPDLPVYLRDAQPPVPRWLIWFTLVLLAVVIGVSTAILLSGK
jgi:hypothetical protein